MDFNSEQNSKLKNNSVFNEKIYENFNGINQELLPVLYFLYWACSESVGMIDSVLHCYHCKTSRKKLITRKEMALVHWKNFTCEPIRSKLIKISSGKSSSATEWLCSIELLIIRVLQWTTTSLAASLHWEFSFWGGRKWCQCLFKDSHYFRNDDFEAKLWFKTSLVML